MLDPKLAEQISEVARQIEQDNRSLLAMTSTHLEEHYEYRVHQGVVTLSRLIREALNHGVSKR